ncbi:Uncharacterized BCR, YaiI/YqxD family COG1671 [Legionella lansingensis]|uniref:UPF0178 protein Llan_0975 n=1 Tax=Legionella lansingensis TaxID=45067 RepID=A0A0W0VS35_9GAMM|nr:YaiI/YqxD family protein [Legionella lansingensis]KTD22858.1 hypothetical protein Llan_0975 [Legionella lansingensis]SNV53655.1 Uncharacterized BCR, YaiI/YqxD family COG1671 [Legionella lansingensis]
MKIWLDGDACPKAIKTILFRAAIRTKTTLIIVANHFPTAPASPFIKKWQVPSGFDRADNQIITDMEKGDLVITADIPLADAVVTKGGKALSPRGQMYSTHNIKQCLAMRNLNESLRSNGLIMSGQAKMCQKEIQNFANHLDKFLKGLMYT